MDIPSDLTGLFLFVILLCPGFAYNGVRARRRPTRLLTSLQETAIIVSASLVALLVTGIVFGIIRVLVPGVTPDVHSVLFSPHDYLRAHYVRTAWWAIAFMAVAIGGAVGVAELQSSGLVDRSKYLRWLDAPPHPSMLSGWWIALGGGPSEPHDVHVGCTLDDGSYISGRLHSFSQVAEDTADRDLVLGPPIMIRPAGATDTQEVQRVSRMTITARHVVTMTVTYVRRAAKPPSQSPPPAQPAAVSSSAPDGS